MEEFEGVGRLSVSSVLSPGSSSAMTLLCDFQSVGLPARRSFLEDEGLSDSACSGNASESRRRFSLTIFVGNDGKQYFLLIFAEVQKSIPNLRVYRVHLSEYY